MMFSKGGREADGHIYLQNEELSWTSNVKYLGSYLIKDLSEAKEIAMKQGDLIVRVNTLLSNFGAASDAVFGETLQHSVQSDKSIQSL